MANSEFLPETNVISFRTQIERFKELRLGWLFGKKIRTAEYTFSKEMIERLLTQGANVNGLTVHLALDENNLVNVYIESVFAEGTGPVTGPGVGHSPNS